MISELRAGYPGSGERSRVAIKSQRMQANLHVGVHEGRNQHCPGVRRHVQGASDPNILPPTISISIIALHSAIRPMCFASSFHDRHQKDVAMPCAEHGVFEIIHCLTLLVRNSCKGDRARHAVCIGVSDAMCVDRKGEIHATNNFAFNLRNIMRDPDGSRSGRRLCQRGCCRRRSRPHGRKAWCRWCRRGMRDWTS